VGISSVGMILYIDYECCAAVRYIDDVRGMYSASFSTAVLVI
jgi:hypothetical protein